MQRRSYNDIKNQFQSNFKYLQSSAAQGVINRRTSDYRQVYTSSASQNKNPSAKSPLPTAQQSVETSPSRTNKTFKYYL